MSNSDKQRFTVLFDYDSLIYKAVYRIVSVGQMRDWFKEGKTKEWMRKEIIALSINRLTNMGDRVLLDIEETGADVYMVKYYITVCPNSFRRALTDDYKKSRRQRKYRNRFVSRIRNWLVDMKFAEVNDRFEADDLIADDARKLNGKAIIATMDKDLKQIEGFGFDYYRPIVKDEQGNKIPQPCRGLYHVTELEAARFFWSQMLTGDGGDDIKGLHRVGPKTAKKVLDPLKTVSEMEQAVKDLYEKKLGDEWQEAYDLAYQLLKLGTDGRNNA